MPTDYTVSLAPQATIPLDFDGAEVRFVGTPDRPEWVAADVCGVLDLANVSRALADFDDDEKGITTVNTPGGSQKLATVYEAGLYKLIFKSRKPEAKKFQKWILGEVLPSIRRHGTYPPPEDFAYPISLRPYTSRVVWAFHVRKVLPPGHWCVFIEGAEVLIGAEHLFGPANLEMKQYDLIDGSMGKCYANYRKGKPWAGESTLYRYTFPKGDPRGTVYPNAYPLSEIEHFKHWLHTEYMSVHFPEYVRRKYGAKRYQAALPVFADMGVLVLAQPKKN